MPGADTSAAPGGSPAKATGIRLAIQSARTIRSGTLAVRLALLQRTGPTMIGIPSLMAARVCSNFAGSRAWLGLVVMVLSALLAISPRRTARLKAHDCLTTKLR